MKRKIFSSLLIIACLVGVTLLTRQYLNEKYVNVINQTIEQKPSAAGSDGFKHFDATQFGNAHLWLGDKITIVYENQLLGEGDNYKRAPDEASIRQLLLNFKDSYRIIFSFQSWPIISNNTVDPQAVAHAQWYLQVIKLAREVLPDANLGIIVSRDDLAGDWFKFIQPVIEATDSIYPFFDVSTDDLNQLSTSMQDTIFMTKMLNMPVYPMMWHKGSGGTYQNKILPDSIIQMQCKFIRANANGVVWWSGAGETWDGGAWYPAAQECLK